MHKINNTNERDFIWVAKYIDGGSLCERDPKTKQENEFKMIQRDKLLQFGLSGFDMNFFFFTYGGHFDLNGHNIDFDFEFKEGNKIKKYKLTGAKMFYKDIIQYKEAEAYFAPLKPGIPRNSHIIQYNLGYKTSLNYPDLKINFQPIVHIPVDNKTPVYMSLKLVLDRDIKDGRIIAIVNNKPIEAFNKDFQANKKEMVKWIVRKK